MKIVHFNYFQICISNRIFIELKKIVKYSEICKQFTNVDKKKKNIKLKHFQKSKHFEKDLLSDFILRNIFGSLCFISLNILQYSYTYLCILKYRLS